MESRRNADRVVPALVIAGAAVTFTVLVIAGGAFYQSFDEAKYVGLGRNLVAGRGYTTVFGSLFLTHPPAWPLILAAPEAWFGVDPLAVGRLLNVLSGAGLIVLTGLLAWRIRPAAGGLAAAAMLGVTYLSDLTRTARLDVPGAAITVLAVLVGTWAMRRDSVGRALVAGLLFAVAFLVKETSVVFLAVPTLGAIFEGRSAARLARLTGAIGLTFAIGTAWWFVVVADQTGRVFRTSLPAWTLVPLGIGVGGAILIGLAAPAILARRPHRVAAPSGIDGGAGHIVRPSPTEVRVGVAATLAWAVVLVVLLARSPELGGAGLIDSGQIRTWLVSWQRTIAFPVLFAASGLVLAVAMALWYRARPPGGALAFPGLAASELVPAVIVSVPFLIFVVATGEPPRNDFAPMAFAFALAGGGWVLVLEGLVSRRQTRGSAVLVIGLGALAGALAGLAIAQVFAIRGAVVKGAAAGAAAGVGLVALRVGLEHRGPGGMSRLPALSVPAILVIALVGSALLLGIQVNRRPGSAETATARTAVATIAGWVRHTVPPNETLAVGSLLGNETAIELPEYRVVKLAAREASASSTAPLGLSISPGDAIDDWLSVDPHPRKTTMFLAFDAGGLVGALDSNSIAYWIYVTGETTAAPTIVPALTPAHGFDIAAHWTFGEQGQALEAWVFRIAPDQLGFGDAPIRIAPAALTRLVGLLAATPNGPAIATRLAGRILVDPNGPAGTQAMLELRQLAAR